MSFQGFCDDVQVRSPLKRRASSRTENLSTQYYVQLDILATLRGFQYFLMKCGMCRYIFQPLWKDAKLWLLINSPIVFWNHSKFHFLARVLLRLQSCLAFPYLCAEFVTVIRTSQAFQLPKFSPHYLFSSTVLRGFPQFACCNNSTTVHTSREIHHL